MAVRTTVQLGQQSPVEVVLRDEAWLGGSAEPAVGQTSPFDVVAAVRESLQSPAGFPPISQAMVPGDRVAIALGDGVRQPADVVRGVVESLQSSGAGCESIVVVAGTKHQADALRRELADLTEQGFTVVAHTANDEKSLCYLAAVDDAPLLICRELFEADVVIPVGCGRLTTARDARGPYEALFPLFSDVLTQRQYAQADALDSPAAVANRRRQTDQAGWLLGAALVVQVVPSRGGGVAQVHAGDPDEVAKLVAQACDTQWTCQVAEPAKLVIVTLTGGPAEQTWDNVARALHAAARVADQDYSAVAVCTELDDPPGETLRQLMATGGDLERAAELADAQTPDAAAAWEIYKALCRGPVYFMSQLDAEAVEDLGMTPVSDMAELTRLAERSENCTIVNEAQHAVPRFVD